MPFTRGILSGPNKITRRNWTQKSQRNLLSPKKQGISFGSTTSSNLTNTINYTTKHSRNNISQSRQPTSQGRNLGSYRNISSYTVPQQPPKTLFQKIFGLKPTHNSNIQYAQNLKNARISSKKNITPLPNYIKHERMSPDLARKYAEVSHESNDPQSMIDAIKKLSLSKEDKDILYDRVELEYRSGNFGDKWNSLPPGIKRRTYRKTRKQSRRSCR